MRKVLDGEKAFRLYDTYGFPLELTKEILAENGMSADTDGFSACMQKQRDTARAGRKNTEELGWEEGDTDIDVPETVFHGYDTLSGSGTVLALYRDGKPVQEATAGDQIVIYLDQTPFYAEGGGQVGDKGFMSTPNGRVEILNTTKSRGVFAHKGDRKSVV